MRQPIQCGDLPLGACLQMGAIALAAPLFAGALCSEALSYYTTQAILWRTALLVVTGLAVLGALLALWVRSNYQAQRGAPNLDWVVLLFCLLFGAASGDWPRAIAWSLFAWVGVRWLPRAIFTIGSMC